MLATKQWKHKPKGSVLAAKAVETHGKGSVLAVEAVEAQGKGSVSDVTRRGRPEHRGSARAALQHHSVQERAGELQRHEAEGTVSEKKGGGTARRRHLETHAKDSALPARG